MLPVIQKFKIRRKSRKTQKSYNLAVFSTLSTSNSESMAYIQVFFHMHVVMIALNGSTKGQPDWVKGAGTMAVQI